jgi:hypothetical protein
MLSKWHGYLARGFPEHGLEARATTKIYNLSSVGVSEPADSATEGLRLDVID